MGLILVKLRETFDVLGKAQEKQSLAQDLCQARLLGHFLPSRAGTLILLCSPPPTEPGLTLPAHQDTTGTLQLLLLAWGVGLAENRADARTAALCG